MKIATWNIERLKHYSKIDEIEFQIKKLNADILVLTETDERISYLNFKNRIDSSKPLVSESIKYKNTENRISIFSNYEVLKIIETYDKYTSLCVEFKTELGNLIVYGTIMGVFGNRNSNFNIDLAKQIEDFEKLAKKGNLCVIGDYNISFSDNYYFTKLGRDELNKCFEKNNLELLSRNQSKCIDHIAITNSFVGKRKIQIIEWNDSYSLSDHKGICAIIE